MLIYLYLLSFIKTDKAHVLKSFPVDGYDRSSCLSRIIHAIVSCFVGMSGARESAVMVLTQFSRNIPISKLKGLRFTSGSKTSFHD